MTQATHHTQESDQKRNCDHCMRLIGVHNWSKRAAPHTCGCQVLRHGKLGKVWCHACPVHGDRR